MEEKQALERMNKAIMHLMVASGKHAMTARQAQVFLIIAQKEDTLDLTRSVIAQEMSGSSLEPVDSTKVTKAVMMTWTKHINMPPGRLETLSLTGKGRELRKEILNILNV